MFFQEIQIDKSDLLKLLASDHQEFAQYMSMYFTRKFYIGNTGVNRKTLKDWETAGLLPYSYNEKGWRKFSFIEWVWLECIHEFRNLGVSIDRIKTIKGALFAANANDWFQLMQEGLENYDGEIYEKERIKGAYKLPELTDEIRSQIMAETQMSYFMLFVIAVVVTKHNLCITYNNSGFCSIFSLGVTTDDIRASNQDVFKNLINDSFVVVNMKKVISKLFQNSGSGKNDDFIIDFLSTKEKKIFDHIRSSNAKEIIIKFDNNREPTHIKVNRNQISKETLNKVARYLKEGSYQTIEFTTRDGKLIKYEEQDSIKL